MEGEVTLVEMDEASGRWVVELANGDRKAVKPENLEALAQPRVGPRAPSTFPAASSAVFLRVHVI